MAISQDLKLSIFNHCQQLIQERILNAQNAIDVAQESANNETKSSAGDKFETGRAMMHLEKEKHSRQLAAALRDKQVLDQLNLDAKNTITSGALMACKAGVFFIGVGLGKITMNNQSFIAISLASPVGQQLSGKQIGATFNINGTSFEIKELI